MGAVRSFGIGYQTVEGHEGRWVMLRLAPDGQKNDDTWRRITPSRHPFGR